MYKKILCTTDFSQPSLECLQFIDQFADKLSAQIVLLHVCDFINPKSFHFNQLEKIADGKTYKQLIEDNLKIKLSHFLETSKLKSKPEIIIDYGDPKELILEHAKKLNVDLIALSKHGHNFIHKLLIGSTTQKILKTSPIDVFVFQKKSSSKIDSLNLFVDFSPLCEELINKSISIASNFKTSVYLNHLVELNTVPILAMSEIDTGTSAQTLAKIQNEEREIALTKMDKYKIKFDQKDIKAIVQINNAKDFRIAENLLKFSNRQQNQIHVLAAHSKNKLEKFLNGSVVGKFIEICDENILVIRT